MIPLGKGYKLVFQQDNAPSHKTQNTITDLRMLDLKLTNWPPYSPDLNIIENVWAILKREVRKHNVKTKIQLQTVIAENWNKLVTKKLCQALYSSMTRRLEKVYRFGGLRM